jgi:hypothetical protein
MSQSVPTPVRPSNNGSDFDNPSAVPANIGAVATSAINAANGVAGLDGNGDVVGQIVVRKDTAANLASVVLVAGQPALATDTLKEVIGDGANTFANLAGTATSGTNGSTLAFAAASVNAFPTASQSAIGAGSVDMQGNRTQTYQTVTAVDSFAAGYGNIVAAAGISQFGSSAIGYGNTVWSSSIGSAATAFGASNIVVATAGYALGSTATVTGSLATGVGQNVFALAPSSLAAGSASVTGYDGLPGTISGTTFTITASGDFRTQLSGSTTTNRGNVIMSGVSGGTANAVFGYAGTNKNFAFSAGVTTVTIDGTIGDRTAGNINCGSSSGSGLGSTALSGGRTLGKGSTAIGSGSLAYKQGQYAQSNTSLGGTASGGIYPCTVLNTNATGATILNGPGLSQYTRTLLYAQSTTSSAVIMTLDGLAANYANLEGLNNTLNVQNNKTLDCTVKITGRSTAGVSNGSFIRRVLIKNIAGTVSLVGSVQTVGSDITDGGAGLWTIAITADATNKCLQVSVTGDTGGTNDTAAVNWIASVEANELVL